MFFFYLKQSALSEDETRDLLFEVKSKFFNGIPHPQLIRKYYNLLIVKSNLNREFKNEINLPEISIKEFVKIVYDRIIVLKNNVATENSVEALAMTINELYLVQYKLIEQLSTLYINSERVDWDKIKMSEPYNHYELVKFINNLGENNDEIKQYICNEIEGLPDTSWSVLTKAVLQSHKIIKHGK